MAKNTLAIVGQNLPSLILKDGVTGLYSAPSVLPVGTGNGCAFSPDGTKLAVCHNGVHTPSRVRHTPSRVRDDYTLALELRGDIDAA